MGPKSNKCPEERRHEDRGGGGREVWTEAEAEVMNGQEKELQESGLHQKLGESHKTNPFSEPLEGTKAANTLISDFGL